MPSRAYRGQELETFALASRWKAYVAEMLRPYIRGAVLEVGAGIGETTRVLLNEKVTSWLCLEPDAQLAARLRQSAFPATKPQPQVVVSTLDDLNAENGFDTILYVDVLEHIASDRSELARAACHLRTDGTLIVLAPAFNVLFSPFDRAIGHYRRYTRRSLSAVFPSDLRAQRTFYADSMGALLSLANRLLMRQQMPTKNQILLWDRHVIPISRIADRIMHRWIGRSVVAVYTRPA